MKLCKKCNETKALAAFHKNKAYEDGLHYACRACEKIKKSLAYHKDIELSRAKGRARYALEKEEVQAKARAKRHADPEGFRKKRRILTSTQEFKTKKKARRQMPKNKLVEKNGYLKYEYGITLNEFNDLSNKQGNICYICGGVNADNKSLSVDHCHTTEKIRGLLCNKCNRAIGLFNDDPELILKAYHYVLNNDTGFTTKNAGRHNKNNGVLRKFT